MISQNTSRLPVGTIHKDPRNAHVYIIEEKKINECLSNKIKADQLS
jgi:hypothetical protein